LFKSEIVITGGCNIGVGVGVGEVLTEPLFQTNFFPDLTHVKVLPEATDVIPKVLQLDPALTAALAGIRGREIDRVSTDKKAISFLFIRKA
jgi:hypothetical protein